jgi:hypothetical protein
MAKKNEKEKEKDKKLKKEKKKPGKADKKKVKKEKKPRQKTLRISAGQRLDMIATAAYYIAEKHGFDPNRAAQDWEEAERQIEAMLMPEKSR